MKMIVAIIRPDRFEDVQAALVAKDIHLMTVSDVRGCGSQRGFAEQFRGAKTGTVRLLPKVRLDIAVNEEFVDTTVQTILKYANSSPGQVGDGKIFVLDLEQCFRVRTGESGPAAIGP